MLERFFSLRMADEPDGRFSWSLFLLMSVDALLLLTIMLLVNAYRYQSASLIMGHNNQTGGIFSTYFFRLERWL